MRLLLVLLAALLAIGNAQHVNFRRMSSTGTDAGVKADTGYAAPVIGYLWRKYRTQLINRVRGYEGFRIASCLLSPVASNDDLHQGWLGPFLPVSRPEWGVAWRVSNP